MQLTSDSRNPSLKIILNTLGVLVLGISYSALWVGLWELSHAFWYLPAGLRFVAMLLSRPVLWPVFILAEWLAISYLSGMHTVYPNIFAHGPANFLPSLIYAGVIGLLLWHRKRINLDGNSQGELALIALCAIIAALATATALFLLLPADSAFLSFEKFSLRGIFSYALGDVAGVLFLWSSVELVRSLAGMDQPARRAFARDALLTVLMIIAIVALLSPTFESAMLGMMFLPILYLTLKRGLTGAMFSLMTLNGIAGLSFWLSGNSSALFDTQVILVSVGFTGLFLGASVSHQAQLLENIRRVSQRLITTQEMERKRISRDLHDHVGQVLTALTLHIAILKRRAPTGSKQDFDVLNSLATQVIHDVHEIVGELAPRELTNSGLKCSLEGSKFYDMLEAANIRYKPLVDSGVDEIAEQVKMAIFRISQELLSNIAKHSLASECSLKVDLLNRNGRKLVRLQMKDNGRGFDTNAVGDGHGLQNIENRVQALAGEIELSSGNGGTTLQIVLPI